MTLTRRTEPLVAGLPQTIVLDADVSLALTLPNGLAAQWLAADPQAVVSSSRSELEPHAADAGVAPRPPLRLLVMAGAQPVAAVPLVAGLRRTLPDDGGPNGVRVELEIIGWEVRAGTLRSPGDFGSFVELAWRRADKGTERFEPPPLNPMLLRRMAA
jgi:hypothetical protein